LARKQAAHAQAHCCLVFNLRKIPEGAYFAVQALDFPPKIVRFLQYAERPSATRVCERPPRAILPSSVLLPHRYRSVSSPGEATFHLFQRNAPATLPRNSHPCCQPSAHLPKKAGARLHLFSAKVLKATTPSSRRLSAFHDVHGVAPARVGRNVVRGGGVEASRVVEVRACQQTVSARRCTFKTNPKHARLSGVLRGTPKTRTVAFYKILARGRGGGRAIMNGAAHDPSNTSDGLLSSAAKVRTRSI